MILIGNKCDLVEERKISYEEGDKLSKDFDFEFFSETSAKTGFNAKEIFLKAAMFLYDDYILYKKNNEIERESNINMSNMDNFNDSNFIVIDKNNHKDTIKKSLKEAYDILKVGGRIIIRDGIMSEPKDSYRLIEFKNIDDINILKRYCNDFNWE